MANQGEEVLLRVERITDLPDGLAATSGAQHVRDQRRRRLLAAIGSLNGKQSVDELVIALRGCARSLAAADAITLVRREGDEVCYVAEDAIAPLWTGQRFPVHACISGLAMLQNQPVLIPDIYADERVPHAAYEPTFVRSIAMFPIGTGRPVWAMGAYWAKVGKIDPEAVTSLSSLARAAAMAFDGIARSTARAISLAAVPQAQ
jgi:hypothetical protein